MQLHHQPFNMIDPLENQLCRVCDEKAAGFHFGAFTCEGCKSFFGRFCNNQTVIPECKNGYVCVIDKRNRTACKACRLKKCLSVGMSKSGCRYGRRSNWFKIHCLMEKRSGKAPMPVTPYSRPTPTFPASRTPSPTLPSLPTLTSLPSPTDTLNSSGDSAGQSSPSPVSPQLTPRPAGPPPAPHPLLAPLSLYRLSPLLALSPLLHCAPPRPALPSPPLALPSVPATALDWHQTLQILAERRALFEKLQSEASVRAASPEPVDLSVK